MTEHKKHYTLIFYGYPCGEYIFISFYYRCRKWGSKKLNRLSKIIQLVRKELGLWFIFLSKYDFFHNVGENYENFKNLYAVLLLFYRIFQMLQNAFKNLFPCHFIEFSYSSYGATRSWYCSHYPSKVKSEKKKIRKRGLYLKSSTRSTVERSVFPGPWNNILDQYHAFDCTKHIRNYKLTFAQLNDLPRSMKQTVYSSRNRCFSLSL